MSQTDIEIVVDDPTAPDDNSPAVVGTGTVEIVVSLLLLALAVTPIAKNLASRKSRRQTFSTNP